MVGEREGSLHEGLGQRDPLGQFRGLLDTAVDHRRRGLRDRRWFHHQVVRRAPVDLSRQVQRREVARGVLGGQEHLGGFVPLLHGRQIGLQDQRDLAVQDDVGVEAAGAVPGLALGQHRKASLLELDSHGRFELESIGGKLGEVDWLDILVVVGGGGNPQPALEDAGCLRVDAEAPSLGFLLDGGVVHLEDPLVLGREDRVELGVELPVGSEHRLAKLVVVAVGLVAVHDHRPGAHRDDGHRDLAQPEVSLLVDHLSVRYDNVVLPVVVVVDAEQGLAVVLEGGLDPPGYVPLVGSEAHIQSPGVHVLVVAGPEQPLASVS